MAIMIFFFVIILFFSNMSGSFSMTENDGSFSYEYDWFIKALEKCKKEWINEEKVEEVLDSYENQLKGDEEKEFKKNRFLIKDMFEAEFRGIFDHFPSQYDKNIDKGIAYCFDQIEMQVSEKNKKNIDFYKLLVRGIFLLLKKRSNKTPFLFYAKRSGEETILTYDETVFVNVICSSFANLLYQKYNLIKDNSKNKGFLNAIIDPNFKKLPDKLQHLIEGYWDLIKGKEEARLQEIMVVPKKESAINIINGGNEEKKLIIEENNDGLKKEEEGTFDKIDHEKNVKSKESENYKETEKKIKKMYEDIKNIDEATFKKYSDRKISLELIKLYPDFQHLSRFDSYTRERKFFSDTLNVAEECRKICGLLYEIRGIHMHQKKRIMALIDDTLSILNKALA